MRRIYSENLRSFLEINAIDTLRILEFAEREKILKKKTGLLCKNCNRIIKTLDGHEKLPKKLKCKLCEIDMEEKFVFELKDLKTITFYEQINSAEV